MIELIVTSEPQSIDRVVQALVDVPCADPCLVLRLNGSDGWSADFWAHLLETRCVWTADPRQFNYEMSLEEQMWWEITNDPARADSYAYSTTPQPLHTDNAWFADPAEVNFFLMQRQATRGGSQTFYEIRQLIDDLDRLDPGLLHDLVATDVVITKGEGTPPNRTRILRLGDNPRISWNYYRTVRESTFVDELCQRFFDFLAAADEKGAVREVRLETGDCLAMADDRVLHGRRAFSAKLPGERSLLQSMWRTQVRGAPTH